MSTKKKVYRRRYLLIATIETTRKMQGSDEFLICTAQRSGIKRKMVTANPTSILVQDTTRYWVKKRHPHKPRES